MAGREEEQLRCALNALAGRDQAARPCIGTHVALVQKADVGGRDLCSRELAHAMENPAAGTGEAGRGAGLHGWKRGLPALPTCGAATSSVCSALVARPRYLSGERPNPSCRSPLAAARRRRPVLLSCP